MKTILISLGVLLLLLSCPASSLAMIDVGRLSKEQAKELGITMKQRPNGDAGTMVWVEFKKTGFLDHFTYCELQVNDPAGKHLLSAALQARPVDSRQPPELLSFAFSAAPAELEKCAFMVVAYGSSRGDVGYILSVKDFLDLRTGTR